MPHWAPLPLLPCSRAQVCELAYSKATSNPARWVLAVPEDSPVQRPEELAGTIVASELVNTTKKWVSTTLAFYNLNFALVSLSLLLGSPAQGGARALHCMASTAKERERPCLQHAECSWWSD